MKSFNTIKEFLSFFFVFAAFRRRIVPLGHKQGISEGQCSEKEGPEAMIRVGLGVLETIGVMI